MGGFATCPSRIFTTIDWGTSHEVGTMKIAAYTSFRGRADHSFISSTTLSVTREIVYFDTDAP